MPNKWSRKSIVNLIQDTQGCNVRCCVCVCGVCESVSDTNDTVKDGEGQSKN